MDDGRRRPVGRGMAAMLIAGQCTRHGVWRSRRPAAGGDPAPAGGMVHAGMHPPFLFCRAKRETGRARSKEKSVGALRCSGPPRDGDRRIGASAALDLPSGTLRSSASLQLPSRAGWYRPRRGARTHLTSFSFRAFRFATRWRGSCGGLCFRADALVRSYPPKLRPGFPVSLTASP